MIRKIEAEIKDIDLLKLETEINKIATVYRGDDESIGTENEVKYGNGMTYNGKELCIVFENKIESDKITDEQIIEAINNSKQIEIKKVDYKQLYSEATTNTAKLEILAKQLGLIQEEEKTI